MLPHLRIGFVTGIVSGKDDIDSHEPKIGFVFLR
jgi:hypothetical protein